MNLYRFCKRLNLTIYFSSFGPLNFQCNFTFEPNKIKDFSHKNKNYQYALLTITYTIIIRKLLYLVNSTPKCKRHLLLVYILLASVMVKLIHLLIGICPVDSTRNAITTTTTHQQSTTKL